MTDDERALLDRWILTFCEPPPVLDAELMRRLIAEEQARQKVRAMTDKAFKAGDAVAWDHSQGSSRGKVVKKLTSETHIRGHKVAASPDSPEYLVESDKTGARAAHRPQELRKA